MRGAVNGSVSIAFHRYEQRTAADERTPVRPFKYEFPGTSICASTSSPEGPASMTATVMLAFSASRAAIARPAKPPLFTPSEQIEERVSLQVSVESERRGRCWVKWLEERSMQLRPSPSSLHSPQFGKSPNPRRKKKRFKTYPATTKSKDFPSRSSALVEIGYRLRRLSAEGGDWEEGGSRSGHDGQGLVEEEVAKRHQGVKTRVESVARRE